MRPDELTDVGDLVVAAYVEAGYVGAEHGYVSELADTEARDRGAEVWVAVEEGRLLGSVTFCAVGSPYQEVARPGEGEFRMLAVAAAARGRGVGELLVRHSVARSRTLGYDAVALCSMDAMTGAHRLYERLGFTRDPERDWSPVPGVDLWGFTLPLV